MKVLISSRSFGRVDGNAIELLRKAGFTPILNPRGQKLEFEEFAELIKDAIGLIAGTERITDELLNRAKSLRVISRYGVGLDNIDLEAAKRRGIIVRAIQGAPTQAVAELALALMSNLYRRISESDRNIRSGKWTQLLGRTLFGKTLGIVGLGRIGKAVVRLVQPLNMKIIACEPYPDQDFVRTYGIELASLERLLAESDIVSIHVSLTEKTDHLIGKKELTLMKKDAIIVNTARGRLIDEGALINALERRVIGGAAIDVFEE